MSKLITVAGYSFKDGSFKFRTANDMKRADQLEALGDTLVNMTTLPNPMTKAEAAKYLLTINYAKGKADVEAAISSAVKDENPFAKKSVKKTVKVKSTKKAPVAVTSSNEIKLTPKEAARIRAEFNAKLKAAYEAN